MPTRVRASASRVSQSAMTIVVLGVGLFVAGCNQLFPFHSGTAPDQGEADAVAVDQLASQPDSQLDLTPGVDRGALFDSVPSDSGTPLPDVAPMPDGYVWVPPLCTTSCGSEACCDRGEGPTCYPDTRTCLCDLATAVPCDSAYPRCCDKGTGPRCTDTFKDCACNLATSAPCEGAYPTCCDKGTGPRCTDTVQFCVCNPVSGAPCAGSYPICCDVGTVVHCTGFSDGCLCDPTTGKPCKTPFAECCDKGAGARCYASCS